MGVIRVLRFRNAEATVQPQKNLISWIKHLSLSVFRGRINGVNLGNQCQTNNTRTLDKAFCNTLIECSQNGGPIISFTTPSTKSVVSDHIKDPRQDIPKRHFSSLQLLELAKSHSTDGTIRLNSEYELTKIAPIGILTDNPSSPRTVRATIQDTRGKETQVDLMEFAPPFDGKKLEARHILESLDYIDKMGYDNLGQGTPTITSANGIGRSAALIVTAYFAEWLQGLPKHQVVNIEHAVDDLIAQGRAQGSPDFIHTQAQRGEVIKACETLVERKAAIVANGSARRSTNGRTVRELTAWKGTNPIAYKESAKQMQCGPQAIHAFVQSPQPSTKAIAAEVASLQTDVAAMQGVGLSSPEILEAISNQKSVRVSKDNFIGKDEADPLNQGLRTSEQWKQLINLKHPTKNWTEHRDELAAIATIEISADDFLSAGGGFGIDQCEGVLNKFLPELKAKSEFSHLPDQVQSLDVAKPENRELLRENLKEIAKQKGEECYLPIVLLTGTGNNSNHYFTVIYQPKTGNWLNLNSQACTDSGVQRVDIFAEGMDQFVDKLARRKQPIQRCIVPSELFGSKQ